MKTCLNCKHCHQPLGIDWKRDWYLLLIPVIGWIAILIVTIMPKDPWCSVGDALTGTAEANGPRCSKMRTFGACGPDATLFKAKPPNRKDHMTK